MNLRFLALPLLSLFLGSGVLSAADASKTAGTKPGYNVVLDVSFNEKGQGETAKVVESDDPTGDAVLTQIALNLVSTMKQEPHLKDGKAVPFTVRVPMNFPVEGDEGPAANNVPRPAVRQAEQPVFPESLAVKGINGGVILELHIGSYGNVQNIKVLRASHKEFADSATTAVKSWIFRPALDGGVPVESRWRIAISFSSNGKDVDWKWKVAPRPSLGNYTVVRPKAPAASEAPAAK